MLAGAEAAETNAAERDGGSKSDLKRKGGVRVRGLRWRRAGEEREAHAARRARAARVLGWRCCRALCRPG